VCFRETTAIAACVFKMSKTAILFAEIHHIHTKAEVPPELLLEVYKNVDDPDSPYDVKQDFNLRTVLYNFAYEGNVRMSESLRVLISSPSG
jgi:ataxia telangiectasia mutated family protein